MAPHFKDLEDYGIIGNLETCALVGADGSIDWLCLPYLESPSVFAGILDPERGGVFSLRPTGKYRSIQSYSGNTNVLTTTFHSPLGTASITDFMPVKTIEDPAFITTLFRKLEWLGKGEIEFELDFRPRFNYGREIPRIEHVKEGVIARSVENGVFLHSQVPLKVNEQGAGGLIKVREGSSFWFVLQFNNYKPLASEDYQDFLNRTAGFWENWAHKCRGRDCVFSGPWHDLIVRSGLLLKLLTNADNGAIAAAATTSLPESIGGVRNWDYRFSWVRDAAFTVQALYHIGHEDEAMHFREWLYGILNKTRDVSNLNILYPLRNEEDLTEQILDHLSGYKNSSPVRIGNAAAGQRQLDIYGEFLNTVYETTRRGMDVREKDWPIVEEVVDYVCEVWDTKDSGIWEARSGPEDYVYSKVMCWAAIDRGIKIAKENGFNLKFDKWEKTRDLIKKTVLEKGFSRKLNSFVRSFGSEDLDATGLLIPIMGFLPFDDPRVRGTIDAVMKNLVGRDGMVARYRAEDGLPGEEGNFVLCSFWLVMALSLAGRKDEAEELFTKILKYISPLGIISEEIDSKTGKLLGNMPQAFSHIGFINAALHIGVARAIKHGGLKLIGEDPAAPGAKV